MIRVKDYIAKASKAIKEVNDHSSNKLVITLKAKKHADKILISGFID